MVNDFINFTAIKEDLERTPEFWASTDCKSVIEGINRQMEAVHGFVPRSTAKVVREGVFLIKGSTTIEDLISLSSELSKVFGVKCFQIAIHRDVSEAHMLFRWFDDRESVPMSFSATDYKKLSVYVLHYLHLPRPKAAEGWLRYFLMLEFHEDNDIFKIALDKAVSHQLDGRSYEALSDALAYAEGVCKGLVK